LSIVFIFSYVDLLNPEGFFGVVNHEEYGRGTAPKLDDAREQAAYEALVNHRGW